MIFKARPSRIPAARSHSIKIPDSARCIEAQFSAMRTALVRLVAVVGLAASIVPTHAVTPTSEDGFSPRANAQAVASVIDSNGRIIVGGYFTELQSPGVNDPLYIGRLARLNLDGSVDTTFSPGADGPVTAILLEPDGKLVIGGYFTSVSSGTTTATRNRVARFNADGTIDENFDPNVSGTVAALVHVGALARDADGRILIGGEFTTIAPNGGPSQNRLRIARFNSDGSFDSTFTPDFNNVVKAIAAHPSGEIIVAGGFTKVTSAGATEGEARGRIARLTSEGVLTYYNPNADNLVTALAFQLDGKMIAVGNFTSLHPTGAAEASDRNRMARINNDGSLDSEFRAGVNSNAEAVAVTPDGRIIVSGVFRGAFTTGDSAASRADYIARFEADGTLDTSFFPGPSYTVSTFALHADGKIFVGGSFSAFFPGNNSFGIARRFIARLNEDGSLDTSLDPSFGGGIEVLTEQADGRILLGGSFSSVAGITRRNVARISADGVVDPGFDPRTNGEVNALVEQSDKKILIGGSFNRITPNGATTSATRNYIARVTETGELDESFEAVPNSTVTAIAVQADGKILIGGNFTEFDPDEDEDDDEVERAYFARLNANGEIDEDFETTTNGTIYSITVESDGRILIGGSFSSVTVGDTSHTAGGLARLTASGKFVSDFSPNTNNTVTTVARTSDGKILIGGNFTTVTPSNDTEKAPTTYDRYRIAQLNADGSLDKNFDPTANNTVNIIVPLADGDILVGGQFSAFAPNGAEDGTVRRGLARLNADGTLDTAYDPNPSNQIYAMIVQDSGDAVVAGSFTGFRPTGSVAVQLTGGLARIKPDGSVDTGFTLEVVGATGDVRTLAYRADGTMFIGGAFASIAGSTSHNLIRLRSEGIPDTEFHADADGSVEAVIPRTLVEDDTALNHRIGWLTKDGLLRSGLNLDPDLQFDGSIETVEIESDGSILIGGSFSVTLGDTYITNLARFKPDGSLDENFNPGPDDIVYDILLIDDQILLVGSFTELGETTRNRIALVSSTGELDLSFDPNSNGTVLTAALQPDGKILIGGQFTTLTPNDDEDSTDRNRIARLNTDGTLDTEFDPNANYDVNTIVIEPGSSSSNFKIVIGGSFTSLQPNDASESTTRNAIARILADGTLDEDFDPNGNGTIVIIRRDADGLFVVGGQFSTFQPNDADDTTERNNLARIKTDGTVDESFDPNVNSAVLDFAFQSDGSMIIGGIFTGVNDVARNRIARIFPDGTLDGSFNPNADGSVSAVGVFGSGEYKDDIIAAGSFSSFRIGGVLLAGGEFQEIGNADTPHLALLSTDGTPVPDAVPAVNGAVRALALDQAGRIVMAGDFTTVGGAEHAHVARLQADDSLDTDFNPTTNGNVHTLALQADEKILIGGSFTTVGTGGRTNLARLNSDGTLDAAFTADVNGLVSAITVQGDGMILVGGSFTALAGSSVKNIGRISASGSIDSSFAAPVVNGSVSSIAVQTDGSVLIGGAFTQVNGTARNGIAKLSSTGALDTAYDPQSNGSVSALLLAKDGKLIVGGTFSKIGGRSRFLIARLSPTVQASISLTVGTDNQSIEWVRSDSGPEILAATFEVAEDDTWSSPIEGTRFTSSEGPGWSATVGEPFPQDKLFFIRARGTVASNRGSSVSYIETVRAFYISSPDDTSEEPTEIPPRPSNFLVETYLSAHPDLANDLYGLSDRADLAWVHYWTNSRWADTEGNFVADEADALLDPKLNNMSARSWIGPGEQALILGVYIADAPARLMVRARGPSLADYGISNPLPDPLITVYSGQTEIASNDDWVTEASVTPEALSEAGITMTDDRDSALVLTLEPGSYTFIVRGKEDNGVGLGELFLLSGPGGRLTNLSTRAYVGEGEDLLIAGFYRVGVGEILVRGLGPELANYDIVNFHPDPYITVHKQSTGTLILANNDWDDVVGAVAAQNERAGALPLTEGSKDAAAYLELGSGGYTVHVIGTDAGQTGVALIDLFELQ